jgi:hypothetical protein
VRTLTLSVLGRGVRVNCEEPETQALVTAGYGDMQGAPGETDLDYVVGLDGEPAAFFIRQPGRERLTAPDDGHFLALFDRQLAIELQRLRRDLYFVHAAVLQGANVAVMLVAKSGGGKSTVCWALLHHGFRYSSDELGPVDLRTLDVHPYPRALTVKREPPPSYPLPPSVVRTSRGFHVPAEAIQSGIGDAPAPLAAIFVLRYHPGAPEPSARQMSTGEAAAHLYANSLNPLAHTGDGLDGAIRIAAASPCFELITTELPATCALLTATLERTVRGGVPGTAAWQRPAASSSGTPFS